MIVRLTRQHTQIEINVKITCVQYSVSLKDNASILIYMRYDWITYLAGEKWMNISFSIMFFDKS